MRASLCPDRPRAERRRGSGRHCPAFGRPGPHHRAVDRGFDGQRTSGPQSYQGESADTLALQNNVAQAIAEQIRISVNSQEQAALKNDTVVNPVAYDRISRDATSGTSERRMV